VPPERGRRQAAVVPAAAAVRLNPSATGACKLRLQQTFPHVLFLLFALPAAAQDVAAGKKVFARCAACHSAETATNKLGPQAFD